MIRFRSEGQPVKRGLNLYRLSDPSSIGGVLRVGNTMIYIRYSKILGKMCIRKQVITGVDINV